MGIINQMQLDKQEAAQSLADDYRNRRAEFVAKYRAARIWVQRQDARAWVLHYGRLIRRLEGKS